MQTIKSIVIACVVGIILCACHRAEPRWGGSSGSRAIPGDFKNMLHSELQGDLFEEPWDSSKARPVFAVLWLSAGGATSSRDGDNRLIGINGHRLRLSLTNRAVYALQHDYTVQDLGFEEPELSQVLDAIAKGTPIEGDLWTNKLAPRLCVLPAAKY
jgi:hypothetical protein